MILQTEQHILQVHAAPSEKCYVPWLCRGSNIPQGVQYSSTLGPWTENRIIADGWHVRTLLQWRVESSERNHLVCAGMGGELHSLVLVTSFLVSSSMKHANSDHFSKWETYSFMFHTSHFLPRNCYQDTGYLIATALGKSSWKIE